MNLTRLLTFHEAAEDLNFSKAAQRLNITQPAISAQVRLLEEELGVKLFTRIGKRLALTEAGELLRTYSRRTFRLIDEAESAMDEMRLVRRGTLKVGTTHTYAGHIMPPLLSRFQAAFPLVKVVLYEGSSLEVVKKVASLGIEVGVVAFPGQVKNVHFELLRKEDLVLVLSPHNPLAREKTLTVKALANENFIMREKGSGTRMIIRDLFRRHKINPSVVFETSSAEFIKEQVARGMGVSFLTYPAVREELLEGRLATVPIDGENLKLEIYSAVRAGHGLSQSVMAFLDIVKNQKQSENDKQ